MNNTVWIALIVAAAVVIVLYIFRHRLRDFNLRASRKGLETGFSTHEQEQSPGVVISGNVQDGQRHKIEVGRENVQVRENLQEGEDHEISVTSDNQESPQ